MVLYDVVVANYNTAAFVVHVAAAAAAATDSFASEFAYMFPSGVAWLRQNVCMSMVRIPTLPSTTRTA
jgi:hypothetical protein